MKPTRHAAIGVVSWVVSGLLLAAPTIAGPIFTVVDLGTLGGSSSQAFGVNASGIAVGSATTQFGYTHATSSAGAGITDLTINSSASEGSAAAINGSGIVAGTQFINGQAYATLSSNGGVQSIVGAGSYALAINDAGQTAGMFTAGSQGHAFVTSGGSLDDLGTLAGGTWTSAYGINGAGDAAGYGNIASGAFRGFTWSPGGGYSELGTFGGANSYAMAINDSGEAAGSAQLGNGAQHAFIANGAQLIDMGTLGGLNSYAYGINDAGEVVGYSYLTGGGGPHAFLYENGVMIDLNNLIDAPGWVLTQAYAINSSGQIVGGGWFDGVEHAFRLDYAGGADNGNLSPGGPSDSVVTPEPGTFGTFGLALFGLMLAVPLKARSRVRLLPLHVAQPRALPRSRVSPR